MKQLKFLKNINYEGKPIWYKDCCYDIISDNANEQGRIVYKLFCEDFQVRGIDSMLEDKFFKVITIEDKKEEIKKEIKEEIIKNEMPLIKTSRKKNNRKK